MSERIPTGDLDAAIPSHPHTTELGPLITETVVRATLSDEENALTRDHHLGSDHHGTGQDSQADAARTAGLAEGGMSSSGAPARPVTGELDRAGETAEPQEVGARRS